MGQGRAPGRSKSSRVFGHPSERGPSELRVGLYARVSTEDQQTIPLQIRAMREYAARRGWAVAVQVKEIGSGASQRERRGKLLEAARSREIEGGVVWGRAGGGRGGRTDVQGLAWSEGNRAG